MYVFLSPGLHNYTTEQNSGSFPVEHSNVQDKGQKQLGQPEKNGFERTQNETTKGDLLQRSTERRWFLSRDDFLRRRIPVKRNELAERRNFRLFVGRYSRSC